MKKKSKVVSNLLLVAGVLASSASTVMAAEVKPQTTAVAAEKQELRLNMPGGAPTADPARTEEERATALVRATFDGLTRLGPDGKVQLSMANRIDVSDDLLTYTFHLRDAKWSNGDPVTAGDFEYAWKRVLNPETESSYAYMLYPVKNAEQANQGKQSLDTVGVKAIDAKTLTVTLEQPTPYFTELTTFASYYPVNKKVVETNPAWAEEAATHVGNGPYKLESWEAREKLILVKNQNYWDKAAVKLDKLEFSMESEENEELALFEEGKLDWAGAPLNVLPTDAMPALKKLGVVQTKPIAGVYWYKFNTEQKPFTNAKIRKAFAYAIHRQEVVDTLTNAMQMPAMGAVPLAATAKKEGYFKDNDKETAKKLLAEGMKELGLSTLPPISLSYNTSEGHQLIAQTIQKQWRDTLGVDVKLENKEWKVFLEDMHNGNYQIGRMGWLGDYSDPINFLELFKDKDGGLNDTKWENSKYQALLNQSATQKDPDKRRQLLAEAEAILMDEMPVAPIYFYTNQWVQNEKVKGIVLDGLGSIDYKWAYKE
ncbi:peptide ABC transporter substrate-binding protein [Brevibacillus sp. NRS-1366]|uniref:peptide ABC transporter substrate-binding protein n=1 Tax=Brevibacillus sp. NRS-1366 TaxID=3233899 RepID=UPI003D23A02D